jgi:gluconate 5-dehydrogenase
MKSARTDGDSVMTVLDRFRLDGKRVLITGGSRGFGRAIALAVTEAGADVALVGRDPDALARTAQEVRARGHEARTYSADVGDPAVCEDLCRRVLAEGAPIDVLVTMSADAASMCRLRRPTLRRGTA